ncbi:DUF6615 family protein [Bacillus cereus]|uniref:Uncharacterized protein n=1 Tax=Bacillus cereus TaxID=1396 RepID=A0A9X6VMR2_BACCE|nr:DUF6615 family protein [Bacillus cereus]PFC15085.1 hypothetical protein CN284_00205 [Bacillus cereus]PFD22658.1 hypothetical protein CN263_09090 [Bacillus cereus]
MNNKTVKIFEKLAVDTWERIKYGEQLGCRQGEETITDINLLEIMRAQLGDVIVHKSHKGNEAITGLDWEWWIGSNTQGWWRYAVQAKKLSPDWKYKKLRHKVKGKKQIDILEIYAQANNCIPLYCFYNYLNLGGGIMQNFWHCNLPYNEEQLGCTIVPIDIVRNAYKSGADKSFFALHSNNRALPWRCLVKCNHFNSFNSLHTPNPLAGEGYENVKPYEIKKEDILRSQSNPNLYNKSIEISPKRILIIDVGNS